MRSTPLLPSLPGPLWPGVIAPDKRPIYGLNRTKACFFHYTDFCIYTAYLCGTEVFKIELSWHRNCVFMLNWIIWNKTVWSFNSVYCPVSWGCRILWLHLCRGVRLPPISRSVLDMILNNPMVRFQQGWSFVNAEYPFIAIASSSTLARNGITW